MPNPVYLTIAIQHMSKFDGQPNVEFSIFSFQGSLVLVLTTPKDELWTCSVVELCADHSVTELGYFYFFSHRHLYTYLYVFVSIWFLAPLNSGQIPRFQRISYLDDLLNKSIFLVINKTHHLSGKNQYIYLFFIK